MMDSIPIELIDEQNWRSFKVQNLNHPYRTVVAKNLKDFVIVNGKVYFRGGGGVLARAVSLTASTPLLLNCIACPHLVHFVHGPLI